MCHGNPEKIDQPKVRKQPQSMPSTHWTKNDKGELVMHGSRHLCTFCHVQQADAEPLVETVH
jgi:nitrate reductase cytochrome c-type subunit